MANFLEIVGDERSDIAVIFYDQDVHWRLAIGDCRMRPFIDDCRLAIELTIDD
jgi:hypothetical protein